MTADVVAYAQEDRMIEREDGFVLVHCTACGWDIVAPSGQLFAWALDLEEAEAKIKREKQERLWH
jgi:hypothetical protein